MGGAFRHSAAHSLRNEASLFDELTALFSIDRRSD